jgi:hypothetical protein
MRKAKMEKYIFSTKSLYLENDLNRKSANFVPGLLFYREIGCRKQQHRERLEIESEFLKESLITTAERNNREG